MKNPSLRTLTASVVPAVVLFSVFVLSSTCWSADQLVLFRNAATESKKDNVSISPYGANLAIALIAPGTKGETETELKSLLGYNGYVDELAGSLKIADYAKENSPIKTATSLWIQQGFDVLPTFVDAAKKNFAAQVEQVDFQTNPDDACKNINEWVDKNTNSKIKKLFEKVSSSDRVIAVSAIYFLDEWLRKFSKQQTQEEDFTLQNGEKKKVNMMRNKGVRFNYGKGLNSQWVELPYKTKGFSAVVILPDKGIELSSVIAKLTSDNFGGTLKTLKTQNLDVKLPQFKVEYSTSLKSALSNAGVKKIFTQNADLTGIAPSRDLVVSDVLQKVFIKVDETGTEAAAATGISVRTTSIDIAIPQEFYVDRPFIFVVCEGNNILFASAITQP
ncbi:MAG: serpin family protein, partial [Planctomycetaceae bacterium]|nr:serpin family protein [Planctomycetaceae bacterium]